MLFPHQLHQWHAHKRGCYTADHQDDQSDVHRPRWIAGDLSNRQGCAQEDFLPDVEHPTEGDQSFAKDENKDERSNGAAKTHGTREDHELAPEAGQRWNSGDAQEPDEKCRSRERHASSQATQLRYIASPGDVGNVSCAEEQGRLAVTVTDDVQDTAPETQGCAQTSYRDAEEYVAEMRDGRISQQPLQVILNEVEGQSDENSEQRHAAHEQ